MALMGVALGVTSIVSVHLISGTVARQLDALVPASLARYTHFMHRDALSSDDYFQLRRQWRAGVAQDIQSMSPIIDETVLLNGKSVRVLGVDLMSAGEVLRESVLVEKDNSANGWSWQGVWVDATLVGQLQYRVNGVLALPAGTVIADIGVAQSILGWPDDRLSYVGISLVDRWGGLKTWGENLMPGFGSGLPSSEVVFSGLPGWHVRSLAGKHPASTFGKSVLFNISALGLLAMLVSWFLIYQVAVSWLRRLWPVLRRLNVLGVQWRALCFYFVSAMIMVGLVSGVLGLFIGQALAEMLFSLAVGGDDAYFPLEAWVVGKGLLSALGVCCFGGAWAFRSARRPSRQIPRRGWLCGGLIVLAGSGVFFPDSGLIGGFLSIAILSMVAVSIAGPLLEWLRGYAGYIRGPYFLRLSLREALWYPQDLAVALSGLSLAVATAIGVTLMIDSFRTDFSRMLERRLSYDVVVQGDSAALHQLQSDLGKMDAVSRVQAYSEFITRLQGVPVQVEMSQMDRTETARYGYGQSLSARQALISEQAARALGLKTGEGFRLESSDFEVMGVFQSFGDIQPRILVGLDAAPIFEAQTLSALSLNVDTPSALSEALRKAYPQLELTRQSEIRRLALATFDRTFTITTVLILIALLVAAIGVYIAVTTLRLNKQVSTKLLVALGVSHAEEAGMDFVLGLGIGMLALVLALPLGICFGWILCAVINPRAFGWTVDLQLSAGGLFWPVFWGLTAAAMAGVIRIGRKEGVGHDDV